MYKHFRNSQFDMLSNPGVQRKSFLKEKLQRGPVQTKITPGRLLLIHSPARNHVTFARNVECHASREY